MYKYHNALVALVEARRYTCTCTHLLINRLVPGGNVVHVHVCMYVCASIISCTPMNKGWQHGTGGACTFSFVARCDCQERVGKGRVSVVKFCCSCHLANELSSVVSG